MKTFYVYYSLNHTFPYSRLTKNANNKTNKGKQTKTLNQNTRWGFCCCSLWVISLIVVVVLLCFAIGPFGGVGVLGFDWLVSSQCELDAQPLNAASHTYQPEQYKDPTAVKAIFRSSYLGYSCGWWSDLTFFPLKNRHGTRIYSTVFRFFCSLNLSGSTHLPAYELMCFILTLWRTLQS